MDIISRISEGSNEAEKQIREDLNETKQVSNLSDIFSDNSLGDTVPPKRKSSEYLKSSTGWVYACVNAIADEVAMINLRLYKYAGKDVQEIASHPILDVLYRANEFMTKFDLFWLVSQYLELTGEAPLFISYNGLKPDKIILLRPDRLQIIPGTTGEIIKGYKYSTDGRNSINLEPHEVVFLRNPDPDTPFRGKGTLSAAARSADIDEYSEEYNKRFFYNSARPDAVLQTAQKLTKDQLERTEKKFKQKFQGLDNSHKLLILQGGLEYKPMSLTQKDMDFMEQQRFSRDKILGIFRVPRTALGITDDVNRANAEATDYIFAKRKIKPVMQRITEQLNEFFVPLFANSENMFLDYDDPVPEALDQKLLLYGNGLQNGWLSINEVRSMQGLPPAGDEADKLRVPLNFQPIDSDFFSPSDPSQNHISKNSINARDKTKLKALKLKSEVKKQLTDVVAALLSTSKKGKQVKRKEQQISDEEKPMLVFQTQQLSVGEASVPAYRRKMDRIFNSQRKRILDEMPTKAVKGKKALDPKKFKLDPEQEADLFASLLDGITLEIIKDQSELAYRFIGLEGKLTIANDAVKNFITHQVKKIIKDATKDTNDKLASAIINGLDKEESVPQIRKRVGDLFDDMKKYRSERIARTETLRASNFAATESYKESGFVKKLRWLTALDDRTCEWCGPMNGKTIGIGDNFFDKGDSFRGRDGGVLDLDYDSVEFPPLHVNCRCTTIPIIQRSFSPAEVSEMKKRLETLEEENKKLAKDNQDLSENQNQIDEIKKTLDELNNANNQGENWKTKRRYSAL